MTRAAALLLVLAVAPAAAGHPVFGNGFDREVAVRVGTGGVTVRYALEMAPSTLFIDAGTRVLGKDEIGRLPKGNTDALVAAYARKLAPALAADLRLTVDGRPVPFRVTDITQVRDANPRIAFVFRADWPAGPERRAFAFVDATFVGSPGPLRLTLDRAAPSDGSTLEIEEEPPVGLRGKSPADLGEDDARAARRAAGTVVLPRPVAPADVGPPAGPGAAPEVTAEGERPGLVADLAARGLPALFDSGYGVGLLLLAAFLFGAAHAFTPGHGKTLVAAYLVGERGTVSHAVLLAVATTVAHTGSVILVAGVLWSVYGNKVPGTTQGVLQLVGGFLVLGVGLWLLLRRVTGKADHVHLFGAHHHDHGPGADHHHHHAPPADAAGSAAGWFRLVLMGLGGGLIPCWDAVLLLLGAAALDRLGFALPLLVAFSLGLGAVLVVLGVGVVFAYRRGAVRFRDSRWFALLPVASAVALTLLGAWLCREGARRVIP